MPKLALRRNLKLAVPDVEHVESQPIETVPAPPMHSMVVPARRAARSLDPAQLAYRLLSPRHSLWDPRMREVYRMWRQVWSTTFAELDGNGSVSSDDFTRQDEHSALFNGSECVGVNAHRWVDFSHPAAADDSYFRPWPDAAREAVAATGTRVCIGSYLTVPDAWRGRQGSHSVKDLLLTLSVARFLRSGADVLVGTLRNDRGMNQLGYLLGARAIATDVKHHGVNVDLVVWDRSVQPFDALAPDEASLCRGLLDRALGEVTP